METSVWTPPVVWWIATGVLIAAELATGTFYLLLLALGTAAAALAAHGGAGLAVQLLAAALVGGASTFAWYWRRRRVGVSVRDEMQLDVGERVQVMAWQADGTAQVSYRGAGWHARFVGSGAPAPGPHVIQGLDGNRLLLDRAAL